MKKLVSLSACCFLLISFWGCSQQTPQEVFDQAFEKTKELSDMHMAVDMEMSLSAQGVTMPVSINIDSLMKERKSEMPQSQTDLKLSMLGMEMSGTLYTKDGYGYGNLLGQKMKYSLDEDDQYAYFDSSLFDEFPIEKFSDLTMEKGDNGSKVFTAKLDDSIMEDYISDSMDHLSGNDADIKLGHVTFNATVSSNGYLESITLSSQIALNQSNDESNGTMLFEMKLIDAGKSVSIDFPGDLDSYPEK